VCGSICCSSGPGPAAIGCPVSRREYKRDIDYLAPEDLDRLHDELQSIHLATYQYKNDPAGTRRRLGFIIDDLETNVCMNPDGNSVDLYGYLSMAVAGLQVQEREIAALKNEVELLKQKSSR